MDKIEKGSDLRESGMDFDTARETYGEYFDLLKDLEFDGNDFEKSSGLVIDHLAPEIISTIFGNSGYTVLYDLKNKRTLLKL